MLRDSEIQVHTHPTQKPLELMKWCLGFAPNAQTILDPFMGSGTTLVAARDLGRRAIGIEIEEKYCATTVARLSQEVFHFTQLLDGCKIPVQQELYETPQRGNKTEDRTSQHRKKTDANITTETKSGS